MQARIQLQRYASVGQLAGEQHAWPLVVQATGRDITSDIFVYRVGKLGDPFGSDQFSCIASVSQLSEIPANRQVVLNAIEQIPWFRTSQLDLVFRTPQEADDCWNKIVEDVCLLVANYNLSFSLQTTETLSIGDVDTPETIAPMRPPLRVQLSYQPAGVPTYISGVQDISTPNLNMAGWLPVCAAPDGWPVPRGAKFFYNIAEDETLQAIWPLTDPVSGNQLYRDGRLLEYGVTHIFDQNTIWWLDFDPATVPGYPTGTLGGNAPWPTDYVSPSSLGTISPIIALFAYK